MGLSELTPLGALTGAVSAMGRGPRALAAWLDERTERRYADFIQAASRGAVFAENADAMTPDDLIAMLRALELDFESEKAALYGRLAGSIATGSVKPSEKRHFIKSLQELSIDQLRLIQRGLVAQSYHLFPGAGSGRKTPDAFLAVGGFDSVDALTFQRLGMAKQGDITPLGGRFARACFDAEMLTPDAVGERAWSSGTLHIVCNEISDPRCNAFLLRLTEAAHSRAIRATNGAAVAGRTHRPLRANRPFFVLLTRNPARLTEEWETVLGATCGSRHIVVVAVDPSVSGLGSPLAQYPRIAAHAASMEGAVDEVLAHFDAIMEEGANACSS